VHDLSEAAIEAGGVKLAEPLPTLTYDVVRHRGHWRVLHIGKHSAPHPSQAAAIACAMKLAAESKAAGRSVVVRLNRTDGRIFDLTIDA
jgi:Uncharacterized protein conserved in bacteria (DUF2188)